MNIGISSSSGRLLAAFGVFSLVCGHSPLELNARSASEESGFEVWLADQSDTRPGFGGQLLIYEGSDLRGNSASKTTPIVRLDLGGETADLCRASTGRNHVRPQPGRHARSADVHDAGRKSPRAP
jgi:hypothetical protein